MTDRNLLIAVTSYNPALDVSVVEANLLSNLFPLAASGWQFACSIRCGEADIGRTRNGFGAMLAAGPFSDMLCMDADVASDPGAIQRLLAHPVDVVMGAYLRRDDSGKFSLKPVSMPLVAVDPTTGEPSKDGLVEVEAAPLGFARISRRCMERMVEAYPDRWYHDVAIPGGKAWSFFEFEVRNHERESEDYSFCRMWRAIGGNVWVDPHLRLSHIGRKVYTGCLADKMRQETPGAVPQDFLKSLV